MLIAQCGWIINHLADPPLRAVGLSSASCCAFVIREYGLMDEKMEKQRTCPRSGSFWWQSRDLNIGLLTLVHLVHGSSMMLQGFGERRGMALSPPDQFGGVWVQTTPLLLGVVSPGHSLNSLAGSQSPVTFLSAPYVPLLHISTAAQQAPGYLPPMTGKSSIGPES